MPNCSHTHTPVRLEVRYSLHSSVIFEFEAFEIVSPFHVSFWILLAIFHHHSTEFNRLPLTQQHFLIALLRKFNFNAIIEVEWINLSSQIECPTHTWCIHGSNNLLLKWFWSEMNIIIVTQLWTNMYCTMRCLYNKFCPILISNEIHE